MIQREAAREPLDTTTEIETPEHVRFRHHVAGPAKRAIAYLIDLLVRGAIVLVFVLVASIAGAASGGGIEHASSGALLLVALRGRVGLLRLLRDGLERPHPGQARARACAW